MIDATNIVINSPDWAYAIDLSGQYVPESAIAHVISDLVTITDLQDRVEERDETILDLLMRNRHLEEEVAGLRQDLADANTFREKMRLAISRLGYEVEE